MTFHDLHFLCSKALDVINCHQKRNQREKNTERNREMGMLSNMLSWKKTLFSLKQSIIFILSHFLNGYHTISCTAGVSKRSTVALLCYFLPRWCYFSFLVMNGAAQRATHGATATVTCATTKSSLDTPVLKGYDCMELFVGLSSIQSIFNPYLIITPNSFTDKTNRAKMALGREPYLRI